MGVLEGAGGHFVSWGPVLSVRDPTDKKTVSAVTRRHRGVFGCFLARRNRVCVLRNFLTLSTLGDFPPSCSKNRDLLVFGVVWALREIPGFNRQKNFDPPKNEKNRKKIFSLRFQKMCSRQKRSGLLSSSAPGAPYRGRAHCKDLAVFRAQAWATNPGKVDFPALGGHSGRNTCRPNLIAW